jgi:hypothetical protein
MSKFKIGDKAWKPKGYKFPCTIVSVFETTSGDIRVVGELDELKMLHIFNEGQLEHCPEAFFENPLQEEPDTIEGTKPSNL